MLNDTRYDGYRDPDDDDEEDDTETDESDEDEDQDADEDTDQDDDDSDSDADDSEQDEDSGEDSDADQADDTDTDADEQDGAEDGVQVAVNNAYGRHGPSPDMDKFEAYEPSGRAADLPDNISYEYLFGPIENQGQTPCCVAFSSSSMVEALVKKHSGDKLQLSRRALYSIAKHKYEPQMMTEGGLYETSALQVYRDLGHVDDSDFPFGTPTPQQLIEAVPEDLIQLIHDLSGFKQLSQMDWDTIMLAMHENGPLLAGMPWHKEWEQVGKDGHMTAQLSGNEVMGGHAIVLVGFSKAKGALRLRNSWGTGWGDNGYGWLPMNEAVKFDGIYTLAT